MSGRPSSPSSRIPLPSTSRDDPQRTPKFVSGDSTPERPTRSDSADSSASSEPDPDNTCAICLGKPSNKSFTDVCLHPFCFSCLVEWSKVKATCPLCQQPFRTIVHNIKENYEYEQYHIFQHLRPVAPGRNPGAPFPSTSMERRGIYEMGYYARLNNSRYRETSPEFYLNNPAQTHRLIPWLNRELVALLQSNDTQLGVVLELILGLISRFDIRSPEMRHWLDVYLRPHTAHFQHEFYCFASSPHDMVMYDRNVEYEYRPPLSYQEAVERLRRAFERDTMQRQTTTSSTLRPQSNANTTSAFRPWSPQPGTSRTTSSPQPSTSSGHPSEPPPSYIISSCSSSSSSDDEDECQVVRIIKPLRDRSPVVIDLCDDSSSQSTISECSTIPASEGEELEVDTEVDRSAARTQKRMLTARPKSVIGAYFPSRSSKKISRRTPSDDLRKGRESKKRKKSSKDHRRRSSKRSSRDHKMKPRGNIN